MCLFGNNRLETFDRLYNDLQSMEDAYSAKVSEFMSEGRSEQESRELAKIVVGDPSQFHKVIGKIIS